MFPFFHTLGTFKTWVSEYNGKLLSNHISWDSLEWRSDGSERSHQCLNTWREGAKGQEPGSSQICLVPLLWARNTQEFPSEHQKALLCHGGDGALALGAQRLWSLLPGDLPKPAGYPALGVPAWVGLGTSRGPFHLSDSLKAFWRQPLHWKAQGTAVGIGESSLYFHLLFLCSPLQQQLGVQLLFITCSGFGAWGGTIRECHKEEPGN